MRSILRLEWFIFYVLLRQAACDAQCFGVGGQKSSASPCNSDATGTNGSHSACCDESKQEACLSTGLCYATQRSDNITFWAEGCTDFSGLDPACPQYCGASSQFINGPLQTSYTMLFCGNSSWCCCFNSFGKRCDPADCCTRNFTVARGLGQVVRQFDDSVGDPATTPGPAPSISKNAPPMFGSRMTVAILASVLGSLLVASSLAFLVSFFQNRKLRKKLLALQDLHARTQSIIAARGTQPLRVSTSMNVKDEAASQMSFDMMQTTASTYYQPPTPSSLAPGYVNLTPTGRRPSLPRNARYIEDTPELPIGAEISELPADKELRYWKK